MFVSYPENKNILSQTFSGENILQWTYQNLRYLLYKAEKLSVCLSVHLHFWHADNSAVYACIETGFAWKMKAEDQSLFLQAYTTNWSA